MEFNMEMVQQPYLQNMYLLDTVTGDIISKKEQKATNEIIIDVEIKFIDELITYVVNSLIWEVKTRITQRKINGEYKTVNIQKIHKRD